ncbi:arabinan endo-1,5-alpha-L-arabinosidase [Phocaeicola sp.]
MKQQQALHAKIRFIINRLVGLGVLAVGIMYSCSTPTAFVPVPTSNPWADDYTALSSMEDYKQWGTYNVHDPACKKIGDTYYMYSTDAIFAENRKEAEEKGVPLGYIQVRKSQDLVNWEYVGWAFPEIPAPAVEWVHSQAGGQGATNIWAPFVITYKNIYRLYYCVSAFGRNTSYIGVAESDSPEGPWEQKGCVVKTGKGDVMNAIDPSVVEDPKTGKWWMHYGSYFGGLFCMELNPETGLAAQPGDQGHLIARRADYKKDNLEAPDVMYNAELDKYYLFTSYDPLMTTYNVRVAYAQTPDGPFVDFFGEDIKDTTNNVPILTAPYRFENHPGWAGTAHCGIIEDGNGRYFMAHQGRLSPQNQLMDLHIREMFFTESGWPVVSPERYAGTPSRTFSKEDLEGEWEVIRITEPPLDRKLDAGQILWGEGDLRKGEQALSTRIVLDADGSAGDASWNFNAKKQLLNIKANKEDINNLIIFAGHDWENEMETILFTGLDSKGCTVWGKRIK